MKKAETRLLVYREKKNILKSIIIPKIKADEIYYNGKMIFKGVEYYKNNVTSITKEIGNTLLDCNIKINYSSFDGSILSALDDKGTRHQPNYIGYNGKKLTDKEFLQTLVLRFGYSKIN